MRPLSQIRREARRRNILSTRGPTRLATWNVRTMYEQGRCANISKEMKEYNIDILGLCETRWIQAGQTRLSTGETIIYSGHEDSNAPHTQGVAVMMSEKASKSLIGWEPVSARKMVARFKTSHKRITLTVIMCYAPTNDAEEEETEEFYDRLRATLRKRTEKEIVVMMGDFNAKVGDDNTGYTSAMGKHGVGVMNGNGLHLVDFCAENNLVIGGTLFPHKTIHKTTWVSPDQRTHNQIDHICIGQKFRRSLLDVRVKRGADAASDHHLVVGKLQLKLRRFADNNARTKYNVDYLRERDHQEKYKQDLNSAMDNLRVEECDTIEGRWKKIKEAFVKTLEESVGKKKRKHKPWITQATLDKMDERKRVKDKLNKARTRAETSRYQEEYRQKHKEVKKSVKEDKRNYITELATEAETAAEQRNMKELYNITRILSGKRMPPEKPVKDTNGTVLTTSEDQKIRWKEHFEELLNRPAPQQTADILPAEEDLPISLEAPTMEEIKKAIRTLNNGKAAGPDGIPAEAMKAAQEVSMEVFHPLFEKIWNEEQVPSDWKEGFIVKLPKKGDLSQCKNYRGIMLLSTPGKIFNRIILDRMKTAVDKLLRDHQAGFRKDRSCPDQIAALRIIVEQSLEWKSSLYINFIDFEKAFDSVDRDSLWKIMRHYGIPNKYVSVIKETYQGMTCRILHGGDMSESFNVQTGVRQGCLLSPFLFLLAIDWVMRETTKGERNGIQWTLFDQLDDLDFADDLALLSHNHEQMQGKTTALQTTASKIGLKINTEKTKVMRINTSRTEPIRLGDNEIEDVTSFTYLGSIVDTTGGTDQDIKIRIGKARTAYILLRKIWNSRELSRPTKIRIFNSNVKAVLFYGAETRRTNVSSDKRVQSFVNKCLRRILRIWWPNYINNQELWQQTNQLPPPLQIPQKEMDLDRTYTKEGSEQHHTTGLKMESPREKETW